MNAYKKEEASMYNFHIPAKGWRIPAPHVQCPLIKTRTPKNARGRHVREEQTLAAPHSADFNKPKGGTSLRSVEFTKISLFC